MLEKLSFIPILCICAAFLGCTEDPVSPAIPLELSVAQKRLVQSDNRFGIKLFKETTIQEEKGKNIFVSPLSVSMALGMTYNGADGSTKEAMETTLELSGLTIDEINNCYKSLIELLTGLDPKVKFQIANSIWYRHDWSFEEEFLGLCKTYFDAEVSGLDFSDPDASSAVMNGWVNENTNGKIEEIVDPDAIDWNTVMFLINAIYFKGTWTYEFDRELTADDQFTRSDGSKTTCRMMIQQGDFQYFETDDFRAIDLPYGDGKFSMTVLVPKSHRTVDWLTTEFSPDNWNGWIGRFDKVSVTLHMPKFKLEYGLTLNDVLKALGMEIAFDPDRADFTKMYRIRGVYIDEVKHKTFVDVNEEGTEAAAATSVEMAFRSAPSSIDMRVDRPFVFAIRESQSQTILFIGKIEEPTL